uniref:DUF7286 family protein n=1 Tax=Halegenticoccus soli TaxID=1985678 RepID=UPI000C6E14FB|nr:hypothetical protein [Halegenticoccus soli]
MDGPNLADVPATARKRLVDANGGPDAIARRAVDGSLRRTSIIVYGTRPDRLSTWAYRDVSALRERVRNVSVVASGGAIATGRANPPARLAAELRERRAALIDPPAPRTGRASRRGRRTWTA